MSDTPLYAVNPKEAWFWVPRTIIMVLSLAGNGAVAYVIIRTFRLHTASNAYILSLTVADLSVTVVFGPFEMACTLLRGTVCNWWVAKLFYDMTVKASIMNLCALTFDRYLSVVHPLAYPTLVSPFRVKLVITLAWLIGIFSPVPGFVCVVLHKYQGYKALQTAFLFFFEFLPSFFLVMMFVRMAMVVKRQRRSVQQQSHTLQFNHKHGAILPAHPRRYKNKPTLHVVGLLVFIFNLCFMASIYKGVMNYVFFREVSFHLVAATRILYHLNSCANWVVYAFMKTDIKVELRRLVGLQTERDLPWPAPVSEGTKRKRDLVP
ncbi:predicted protein [Nematostella vectensis]|uniref:G-protein coupled receptors family 1 profile domain-containing protein n=1 Tax=Nematostella vectensis TaxID=45351 RepID=A7RX52_NEMVE|nr:predicted protein [Nematostella vectensis]|eukprot:XP_001635965.1 predicted protein [Nematostella vectensis]